MYGKSVKNLTESRISVRSYKAVSLKTEEKEEFVKFLDTIGKGPFGNNLKYKLVTTEENNSDKLKGLGTYGWIRNPQGFLIVSVKDGGTALWDVGWGLEAAVLKAEELGWGSCWLGGSFRRSRFEKAMELNHGEILPAILSLGYPDDAEMQRKGRRREKISTDNAPRKAFSGLFFDARKEELTPLEKEAPFFEILGAVCLAPSAHNKQPWRIVRRDGQWDFFLCRTTSRSIRALNSLRGLADLQQIDMGIALCHFDSAAKEKGLSGKWIIDKAFKKIEGWEYCFSWRG